MKRLLVILAAALLAIPAARGQSGVLRYEVVNGDTLLIGYIPKVYVFKSLLDIRKNQRLIRNIKKVYPIAKEAGARLARMEEELLALPNKRKQKDYIRKMEKEITKEYTPILKQMTFSQGKILIKLIDRETQRTPHAIVKELQGGFSAAIWQGIARIFGANLKDGYDKDGDDRLIEQIIILYEAGLL